MVSPVTGAGDINSAFEVQQVVRSEQIPFAVIQRIVYRLAQVLNPSVSRT